MKPLGKLLTHYWAGNYTVIESTTNTLSYSTWVIIPTSIPRYPYFLTYYSRLASFENLPVSDDLHTGCRLFLMLPNTVQQQPENNHTVVLDYHKLGKPFNSNTCIYHQPQVQPLEQY